MMRYVELQERSVPRMAFHPEARCITFETISVFEEDGPVVLQMNTTAEKIRNYQQQHDLTFEITSVVQQTGRYLAKQVQQNGRFTYGYFPCFDKKIDYYNSLRHARTLYAIIEANAMR